MKNIYILFFLSISSFLLHAQNRNVGWSVNGTGGILLAHRSIMAHLPESHTAALNFRLSFLANKGRYWEEVLNYPTYGVEFIASSLGNDEILGKGLAGLYFVDVPLASTKVYPSIYGGVGLGWVQKIYHVTENPKNNAIGSHLNAAIRLGFNVNFKAKQSDFQLGMHLMHFSNGASKMPNLGINLPYLQLGFTHYISPKTSVLEKVTIHSAKDETHWRVLGVFSRKDVYPLLQKPSNVYALSLIRTKYKSKYWSYDLGMEWIANQAHAKLFPERNVGQLELLQIGFYAGYVLTFDRLDLFSGMGGYVKNDLNIAGWLYQKVGARYQFNKNWGAQLAIKANFGKADYFEYGINYTLNAK